MFTVKSHDCIIGKCADCKNGYFEGAEALNPFPEAISFCVCECHSSSEKKEGEDE
jgi:hypothetical protein